MTDADDETARAATMSRREMIGWGGALAAGLVVTGRRLGATVDDPIRGVREPGLPGTHFPGRSAAIPSRRGRKGYRPRPAYPLGKALGAISIPALGISDTMYEGVDLWVLDSGPGHWPGTVLPGQAGNCVVAGHRVSHSAPFRHIDSLRTGDEMSLGALGLDHTYVVTNAFIVDPTELSILNNTETNTATLFACHPPGSVAERYVVTFVQA